MKIKYPLEGWHPTSPEGWIEWCIALRSEFLNLFWAAEQLESIVSTEDARDVKVKAEWNAAVASAKKVIEGNLEGK